MVLLRMRVHSLQTVGELISAIKTAARAEDLNMMLAFNAEVRCGCPLGMRDGLIREALRQEIDSMICYCEVTIQTNFEV